MLLCQFYTYALIFPSAKCSEWAAGNAVTGGVCAEKPAQSRHEGWRCAWGRRGWEMTWSGWSVGCVGGRAGSTSNAMLRSEFIPVYTAVNHMESVWTVCKRDIGQGAVPVAEREGKQGPHVGRCQLEGKKGRVKRDQVGVVICGCTRGWLQRRLRWLRNEWGDDGDTLSGQEQVCGGGVVSDVLMWGRWGSLEGVASPGACSVHLSLSPGPVRLHLVLLSLACDGLEGAMQGPTHFHVLALHKAESLKMWVTSAYKLHLLTWCEHLSDAHADTA